MLGGFLPFKGRYEEMLDFDKLRPPITVRKRKAGDRFRPLGARGAQKVQDFMVDQKIPRKERARVPIAVDQRHPVWVLGYRIDDRAKVTSSTKRVLKLSAEIQGPNY